MFRPKMLAVNALFAALLLPQIAFAICGDGIREATEECDDANLVDGDGCSSTCLQEDGFVCETPDFTPFIAPEWTSGTPTPNWTLSNGGFVVTQTANSVATVYTSRVPADIGDITFTMRVGTTVDDDFMGWTVGFEDGDLSGTGTPGDRDWLYFNWKQAAQGARSPGLWLNRVTGPVTSTNAGGPLWDSTGNVAKVAESTNFGTAAWDDNRAYRVRMRFTPTRMQVWLTRSTDLTLEGNFATATEQLEFDVNPCGTAFGTPCAAPNFPNGKFGMYAHSQEQTRFRLIQINDQATPGDVCATDEDADTIPDHRDLDSDGDGIPDLVEMSGFVTDPDFDSNGNGVSDWNDPLTIPGGCAPDTQTPARCLSLPLIYDVDQDGIPNHLDLDSDGDGLPDSYEAGLDDIDLDGLPDSCVTVDDEGLCDFGGLAGAAPDTDLDLTPDYLDTDSDNDTIADALEAFDTTGDQLANVVANGTDTFGNGLDDAFDPRCTAVLCPVLGVISTLPDTDGNGIPNHLQACADGYKVAAEGCDDGNTTAGDGCSATCGVETGYICEGTPLSVCTILCGDSIVLSPEICDDGNDTSGDGCDATCQTEAGFTCPTNGGQCLTVAISSPADLSVHQIDPAVSGTATPGALVTVEWDNGVTTISDTTIALANGTWSLPSRGLADGDWIITASVTTTGGTIDDTIRIFVDSVAPAVSLLTPADGTVTNDNTVTVSGTAEASAGIAVTVFDNIGQVVFTGSTTANAAGLWSLNTAALVDGAYTVVAVASDLAGNTASDGPNGFEVDTVDPTVALITPVNGLETNDSTPAISGTAEAGSDVEVTVTNNLGVVVFTGNPTVAANGSWSIDSSTLVDGVYTVSATATDAANNSASAGPNTFTVDTAAPTVSLVTPADNSITNDATVTVSGAAEDGSEVTVTVLDALSQVAFQGTTTAASGAYSVDTSALADGVYTVSVVAEDAAGNTANSGPHSFEVDTTAPAVALIAPADGDLTNDTTPLVSGTADVDADVEVTITDDAGVVVFTGTPTVATDGSWSITSSTLVDGVYTVEVTATDAANNTASAGPNTFTVDNTEPSIALLTPANLSSTNDTTPAVTGTTEPGAEVNVEVRDASNTLVFTGDATVAASGNWSITSTVLPEGTYTVSATATDDAGNTASAGPNTFTVDTTDPAVVILTPADGDSTNDNTTTVSGTAEVGSTVQVVVEDSAGQVVFTGAPTVENDGTWTIDTTALGDGIYTATATATDAGGNSASDDVTFNVDTVDPVVVIVAPADGSFTANVRPEISGTSEPDSTVEVALKDELGDVIFTATVTADATGAWNTTPDFDLANGAYTVEASAEDLAGNESALATSTFNVDTTLLALEILTPVNGASLSNAQPPVTGTTEANTEVTIVIADDQGAIIETLTATSDANGMWTTTPTSPLVDGAYVITATVENAAGVPTTETVNFTVDTTAPDLTLDTPVDGATFTENQPVFSGTGEAGIDVVVEILDADGNVVQTLTTTVDQMGMWTVTPTSPLADGSFSATATGTDAAGNETTDGPVSFTVDTIGPTTTISQPGEDAVINLTTPTITGTSEPLATVEIFIDGESVGQTTADENGDWSFTLTEPLAEGEHTVGAQGTDANGTVGPLDERNFTVDTTAPTVTITSPSGGETVVGPTITVTGTADPGSLVEIIVDGEKIGETTADNDGNWTFDVTLTPGGHTIEATSTDGAGNQGSSGEISFTVGEEEPVTPESEFYLAGNGCMNAGGNASNSLFLLLFGLVAIFRRRK